MKATTKKGVIRTAQKAINALKDLHEDAHTVAETRGAAIGYLDILPQVEQLVNFIKAIQ